MLIGFVLNKKGKIIKFIVELTKSLQIRIILDGKELKQEKNWEAYSDVNFYVNRSLRIEIIGSKRKETWEREKRGEDK